jgi:hypothetical protein
MALDTSKPGTPAEIRLDRTGSDPNKTTLDVIVHGFYVELKHGPDGTAYQKITVPGFGGTEATGAPDLPTARFELAVVTGAKATRLAATKELTAPRTFAGVMVWPRTVAEMDQEGAPEQFKRDDRIYRGSLPYPALDGGGASSLRPVLGNILGITAEVFPVKWNPATKALVVRPATRFIFDHTGTAKRDQVTRDRFKLASLTFANWNAVAGYFIPNFVFYEGDFLFIYPAGYKNELQPLIDQKKSRGFYTVERTTTQTGMTCAGIRAAIQTWYNSRPAYTDKYALLVGDVN